MAVTNGAFDAILVKTLLGSESGIIFTTYKGSIIYARLNNGALELVDPFLVTYGGESGLRYVGESDGEV